MCYYGNYQPLLTDMKPFQILTFASGNGMVRSTLRAESIEGDSARIAG